MESLSSPEINAVVFYLLAGMSLSSGLVILFSKNVVRSIFLLVLVFVGIAGIYMITNAEFVAVTQILVYVGGILILLMFGIMLTNRIEGQLLTTSHSRLIPAIALGGLMFWVLGRSIIKNAEALSAGGLNKIPSIVAGNEVGTGFSNTKVIGVNLMTNQMLALELTAVLLLVALVGAAFIVGNKVKQVE